MGKVYIYKYLFCPACFVYSFLIPFTVQTVFFTLCIPRKQRDSLFGVSRFSVNPACFRQDISEINTVILCQHWHSQIALLTNMGKNSGQRHCCSNSLENWFCSGIRNTGFLERVNPYTKGFCFNHDAANSTRFQSIHSS